MQTFKTIDKLRLEVGARYATGQQNLLKNPNGALGAWGWLSPWPDTFADGTGESNLSGGDLNFYTNGSVADGIFRWFDSEPEPALAGRYAAGSVRLSQQMGTGQTAEIYVVAQDAAGVAFSNGGITTIPTGAPVGNTYYTPAWLLPAGTVQVRLRIKINRPNAAGTRQIRIDRAMLTEGVAAAAVTGFAYREPYFYTDILGPTHSLTIAREPLAPGTLNARVRDATLDPSLQDSLIRPGNPVRVMARESEFGDYQPLFRGEILTGRVRYAPPPAPAAKRCDITFVAVDPANPLANTTQPQGVPAINDLRYLLEGCGVPWSVDGLTNQPAGTPTIVSTNANASVLDQVAITRDSTLGYAWVSRYGVMKIYSAAALSSTTLAVLAEADYNADIDIDFDTARCINEVVVKRLSLDSEGQTITTVFGPYRDEASIVRWGVYREEFTVHGKADNTIAAYAQAILTANANPAVRVNSLTLPITSDADLNTGQIGGVFQTRAHLDLYDKVTVSNTNAGIVNQALRVASIRHTITPKKWLLEVGFAGAGGVAMPSVPPPMAAALGVLADTGWILPTLQNGWVNNGGADVPIRYRRKDGITYLQAIAKNGTGGTVVFNMPTGFRPSHSLIIDGDSGPWLITASGDAFCFGSPSRAAVVAAFPADQ